MSYDIIVPVYLFTVFLFITAINFTLLITVRPTFISHIFKRPHEDTLKKMEIISYLALFLVSIWLGMLTIVLKHYTSYLDFA